jgi:hypothetical protein|tara:strand:- start:304 stop:555 length:252 start_codon:yes stop_codon:yes gene_type:complete
VGNKVNNQKGENMKETFKFECYGHEKKVKATSMSDAYEKANTWAEKLPEMQFDPERFPKPQNYHGGWMLINECYKWAGRQVWD